MTVIDFTVTMAGLEDQLLGRLILKEKNELESQRQNLLAEVQSYKRKIKQLEDDLLFRLSNSTGNLLDDTELVEILAVTKQTAQVGWMRWMGGGEGGAWCGLPCRLLSRLLNTHSPCPCLVPTHPLCRLTGGERAAADRQRDAPQDHRRL